VLTGPVLDAEDPLYKGVRLPLAYWKVFAYDRGESGPATAAYLLDQAELIQELLRREAVFQPGTYRIRLEELHDRTGLDLGHLEAAELPLTSDGLEVARDRVRVREDYGNLVL
jgi:endonuclease G